MVYNTIGESWPKLYLFKQSAQYDHDIGMAEDVYFVSMY